MIKISLPVTIFSLIFLLTSCNDLKTENVSLHNEASNCSTNSDSITSPLLKIDGQIISKVELPSDVASSLYQVEMESFQKREGILMQYALRMHLANKKGMKGELPPLEKLLSTPVISDKIAKAFFDENKARMAPGVKYEKVKGQLKQYLASQQLSTGFQQQITMLQKSGKLQIFLTAPTSPKVTLDLSDYPVIGNKSSTVKIVEVSDYLCGHCKNAHPIVKSIFKKFEDKVSLTQINFSLAPNGKSGELVRGAYCAQKINEKTFWDFHNVAFENDMHGNKKPLEFISKKLKIDFNKFKKCVDSKEAKDFVSKTNAMLSSAGIDGTPTFIINNIKVDLGVQGLEEAINKALN